MRYRPLANHGIALSVITLRLSDTPQRSLADWSKFIGEALDCGINSFEVDGRDPALIDGLGRALQAVDRHLVFVAWRMGPRALPPHLASEAFSARGMAALARAAITRTGLGYIDLVQLDDPGAQDLSPAGLKALKALKAEGAVRQIGIAGEGQEIDAYISTGAFDVLTTPFNMMSGWRDRNRIKASGERNMAVIGYEPYPELLHPQTFAESVKRGLLSWGKRAADQAVNPYAFLHQQAKWTGEEICLAFALTEPGITSVQVSPTQSDHLNALAAVAERELPAGVPAQIELARFGGRRQA